MRGAKPDPHTSEAMDTSCHIESISEEAARTLARAFIRELESATEPGEEPDLLDVEKAVASLADICRRLGVSHEEAEAALARLAKTGDKPPARRAEEEEKRTELTPAVIALATVLKTQARAGVSITKPVRTIGEPWERVRDSALEEQARIDAARSKEA